MNFLPFELSAMSFSAALSTSGPGFVIVLIVLAVLAIFVMFLSKIIGGKKKKPDSSEAEVATSDAPQSTPVAEVLQSAESALQNAIEELPTEEKIPHIPGFVVLDGISEQDAAVVMAITAHKTGIDLARLDFKSIKRRDPLLENISEQDAAAVMAVTSHKTGIPLENLIFNSIKLVEE